MAESAQQNPVIIFGASARAAIGSADRANLASFGIDLFNDVDSRSIPPVITANDFPAEIRSRLRSLPKSLCLYVGGIENDPTLIDSIESFHILAGNSGDVVSRSRSPLVVDELLRQAQLPSAWCLRPTLPACRRFIAKQIRSGGGIGVRSLSFDQASSLPNRVIESESFSQNARFASVNSNQCCWVLQELKEGIEYGFLFLCEHDRAHFIGATWNLTGRRQLNAPPFQYCGSVGPIPICDRVQQYVETLGKLLTNQLGLRGLVGVDVIDDGERCWLLEINPRYTASVEVFEMSQRIELLARHMKCFGHASASVDSLPVSDWRPSQPQSCLGLKLIVYVPNNRKGTVNERFVEEALQWNHSNEGYQIADIPQASTVLLSSQPAFTLLGNIDVEEGMNVHELGLKSLELLERQANRWLAPLLEEVN